MFFWPQIIIILKGQDRCTYFLSRANRHLLILIINDHFHIKYPIWFFTSYSLNTQKRIKFLPISFFFYFSRMFLQIYYSLPLFFLYKKSITPTFFLVILSLKYQKYFLLFCKTFPRAEYVSIAYQNPLRLICEQHCKGC